jgi:hypothetical protein
MKFKKYSRHYYIGEFPLLIQGKTTVCLTNPNGFKLSIGGHAWNTFGHSLRYKVAILDLHGSELISEFITGVRKGKPSDLVLYFVNYSDDDLDFAIWSTEE